MANHSNDKAVKLVHDGAGDIIVTGSGHNGINGFDMLTIRYSGADGSVLWQQRYRGAGDSDDQARALGMDGMRNVVVTGTSAGHYYTAKYAAATGSLLWEKRYPGPVPGSNESRAAAVDASGNVVVTGYSYNGSNYDYATAKYAAVDGTLLWERRYNAPSNGDDRARAVAVDGGGNIVVMGIENYGSGYYTAKYAAANGALLWEKRYTDRGTHSMGGLDLLDSEPVRAGGSQSLALGPNGMVAVTGTSDGDYATVVYRDPPPPAFFADWSAGFGLPGVAASADADPNRDGLPNAVEFILGGNPAVPGTSGRPTSATSGGNMIFTFFRDEESETPDVTLTVESGSDLVTWPAAVTVGPNTEASSRGVNVTENGPAPDTITVTIPQDTNQAKFARLKVTIAP